MYLIYLCRSLISAKQSFLCERGRCLNERSEASDRQTDHDRLLILFIYGIPSINS